MVSIIPTALFWSSLEQNPCKKSPSVKRWPALRSPIPGDSFRSCNVKVPFSRDAARIFRGVFWGQWRHHEEVERMESSSCKEPWFFIMFDLNIKKYVYIIIIATTGWWKKTTTAWWFGTMEF